MSMTTVTDSQTLQPCSPAGSEKEKIGRTQAEGDVPVSKTSIQAMRPNEYNSIEHV